MTKEEINSLFQLNDEGVLVLTKKPDVSKFGVFTVEQEEEIEKENEEIRRSLTVSWEKMYRPLTV